MEQVGFTRDELALINNVFAETSWTPDKAVLCSIAASIIAKSSARVKAIDAAEAPDEAPDEPEPVEPQED